MIIRIEELPAGQKINRMTVDITFEDVENPVVKVDAPKFDNTSTESELPRAAKPVPDEMMDMEF